MDNSDTAVIHVFWSVDKKTTFNARGWEVKQSNGVGLLIIHDKESSSISYEVSLESVLYWVVDTSDDSRLAQESDKPNKYCDTCKIYFESNVVGNTSHEGHDVFHACCGARELTFHERTCPYYFNDTGEQRIGQIINISEDDNGLFIKYKLNDNVPEHLKRFI